MFDQSRGRPRRLGNRINAARARSSDHGDPDGAHRLHSKGATAYREQNNVPLTVVHPAYSAGTRCRAVTSHLDIAPTLVNLTNASAEKKATITTHLPGKVQHVCLHRRRLHCKGRPIRGLFDGRYRFARYFSPKRHNHPVSLEALFKLNDVELYDLEHDPLERNNLAVDRD